MHRDLYDFITQVNESPDFNFEIKAVGCNGCSKEDVYYVAKERHKDEIYVRCSDLIQAMKIYYIADTEGVTVELDRPRRESVKISVEE
jgi:hypothetical protein